MGETAELLFGYLREVLHNPADARLDPRTLDGEFQELGEGLVTFAKYLDEQRELAKALSKGVLNVPPPSRSNVLAAPLKSLHASLRHVTWQSRQVARGDYRQRINFMGEFADAFNAMVEQLDLRQRELEREVERGREQTRALEQSNSLLTSITYNLPQMILVFGEGSHELLYSNKAASEALASDSSLRGGLIDRVSLLGEEAGEGRSGVRFEYERGGDARHLLIHVYSLQWNGQSAKALVLSDVSEDVERVKELELRATQDNQTKLYNRFHGMQTLSRWLEGNKHFSLCFADLDNLKYVNDTFGHEEGDNYIQNTAHGLREFFPDCVTCRIGGDEFMVLAQGFRFSDVRTRMQALNARLREVGAARPYACRISYGIVESDPEHPQTARELLSIADERMYVFKRRNKKRDMLAARAVKSKAGRGKNAGV